MDTVIICGVVVVVCLVIFGVSLGVWVHRHNNYADAVKASIDRQLNVNKSVLESLKKEDFNITNIYYLADGFTYNMDKSYYKMVVADNKGKKICFTDYSSGDFYVVDFKDFINYDVYENDGVSTFTNAVGTSYGNVGVGFASSEAVNISKDLKLIIRIKSFEKSQITYSILSNHNNGVGISKSTALYRTCINTLQELLSFFEIVKLDNLQI